MQQHTKTVGGLGPIIFSYTRADALADGEQIHVTEYRAGEEIVPLAREAGFIIPVYLTRDVCETYVKIPPGVECQHESGRLWDVLFMCRFAIRGSNESGSRLSFKMLCRNDNHKPKEITLWAEVGPVDIDNPAPALTIMTQEDL